MVDSSLTYAFEIIPTGGLNGTNTGNPVTVDITGNASVVSTGSYYDTAYNSSEAASLALTLPGIGTGKIVNLSGLSSQAFSFQGSLLTGTVYTLGLDASLYVGGENETLQAMVDPQINVGSGYSVAFSPNFPGSGPATTSVPDAPWTAGLMALGLGALAVLRWATASRVTVQTDLPLA